MWSYRDFWIQQKKSIHVLKVRSVIRRWPCPLTWLIFRCLVWDYGVGVAWYRSPHKSLDFTRNLLHITWCGIDSRPYTVKTCLIFVLIKGCQKVFSWDGVKLAPHFKQVWHLCLPADRGNTLASGGAVPDRGPWCALVIIFSDQGASLPLFLGFPFPIPNVLICLLFWYS